MIIFNEEEELFRSMLKRKGYHIHDSNWIEETSLNDFKSVCKKVVYKMVNEDPITVLEYEELNDDVITKGHLLKDVSEEEIQKVIMDIHECNMMIDSSIKAKDRDYIKMWRRAKQIANIQKGDLLVNPNGVTMARCE